MKTILGRKPLPISQRKISVNVALTQDTIRAANKYARGEKRRLAEMLRLLIEEALQRREETV